MITKEFGKDFNSEGGALTLSPSEISEIAVSEDDSRNVFERLHPDGWKISGIVHADYYVWVNAFEAVHPTYGKVWGDFEDKVFADTEEGYNHFYKHHTPESWDYGDI